MKLHPGGRKWIPCPRLESPHLSSQMGIELWSRDSPGQIQVDVNTVLSGDPEKVSLLRESGGGGGHSLCRWAKLWSSHVQTQQNVLSTSRTPHTSLPSFYKRSWELSFFLWNSLYKIVHLLPENSWHFGGQHPLPHLCPLFP